MHDNRYLERWVMMMIGAGKQNLGDCFVAGRWSRLNPHAWVILRRWQKREFPSKGCEWRIKMWWQTLAFSFLFKRMLFQCIVVNILVNMFLLGNMACPPTWLIFIRYLLMRITTYKLPLEYMFQRALLMQDTQVITKYVMCFSHSSAPSSTLA